MPWQPRVKEGQRRRLARRLDVELHEAAQTTPALPQGRSKEKSIKHPSRNRQKTISPSPKQEQREIKASTQVDTPATKLTSKPSSSKPSSLPVVKQEQRKAHHPSIALLIPCSSFIAIGS